MVRWYWLGWWTSELVGKLPWLVRPLYQSCMKNRPPTHTRRVDTCSSLVTSQVGTAGTSLTLPCYGKAGPHCLSWSRWVCRTTAKYCGRCTGRWITGRMKGSQICDINRSEQLTKLPGSQTLVILMCSCEKYSNWPQNGRISKLLIFCFPWFSS